MNTLITITTDFGDQFAASQLRAVIANLKFQGQIIENHSVTPFSITEGAFEIKQVAKFSPDGSIHVGVIDPGVGSKRWGIIIQTKRSWFIGPNNGIFYPAANEEGIKGIWRLKEDWFGNDTSNTFHGRDIFIKAAVFLAQGKKPTDFKCINLPECDIEKIHFSEGEILHIDAYGNYKIYWPYQLVIGKKLLIKTKKNKPLILPIVKTFDDVVPNTPLALLGSHNTLEVAINLSSAQKFLQFNLGEKLIIQQL